MAYDQIRLGMRPVTDVVRNIDTKQEKNEKNKIWGYFDYHTVIRWPVIKNKWRV